MQNKDGDLLFCIRTREGDERLPELFYSGGENALLRRRMDQYIVLDKIHNDVKEALAKIAENCGEVLVAEYIPGNEKNDSNADKGIVKEYTVGVRKISGIESLESTDGISTNNNYYLFESLLSLVQANLDKPIKDIILKDDLPCLAAILAREEDYMLFGKYIKEGLPLNERIGWWFKNYRPTPLFYISTCSVWSYMKDPVKMLKYLVKHGADINMPSAEGDTPLGNQCMPDGTAETLKTLLDLGADPNHETIMNDNSFTPLLLALSPKNYDSEQNTFCPYSSEDIKKIILLLNAGADPNLASPDFPDYPPLMQALEFGIDRQFDPPAEKQEDLELIEQLLIRGANPDFTNSNGDTPLSIAERDKLHETVKLLLKYGAVKPDNDEPENDDDGRYDAWS